jgi:predicted MFS family arabinose efflux permease
VITGLAERIADSPELAKSNAAGQVNSAADTRCLPSWSNHERTSIRHPRRRHVAVTQPAAPDGIRTGPEADAEWVQFLTTSPAQRLRLERLPRPIQDYAANRTASWHVLGRSRFRAYFVGSTISNLGTWLQNTAQLLLAYRLTHNVFDVALVTSAQFIGFLTIGPWAGSLAGRMRGKPLLIGTQLASAAVTGVLACLQFTVGLTMLDLVVGALFTGLATTFALPLQTTMLSALVPSRDTKAALAMNSVSYNTGRTVAPVLCLAIMATLGTGWAFALNALSFLYFALVVATRCPDTAIARQQPVRPRAVAAIAIQRPRILLLLAMVAAVTFADDPVFVLGPSLAHQMRVASFWPAYFLVALGLGTVCGALVPRREFTEDSKARPVQTRRAAAPLAFLALSVLTFSLGLGLWASIIAAICAGAAGLLTGSAAQALLLQVASRENALQVMALWAVAWAGTKPIASLADGALASHFGIHLAAVVLVLPALLIGGAELCLKKSWKISLKQRMSRFSGNADVAVSGPIA